MQPIKNRRVLIIDDNPMIHDEFRKILHDWETRDEVFDATEALPFSDLPNAESEKQFEIDSALQGEEGAEMVLRARQEGRPYTLAFIDTRMPPGIDGVETIERIWPLDPEIQIVVCLAYSDCSAFEIMMRLGMCDRLLVLRKPCDSAEILFMAWTLCEKWNLANTVKV